ncbi:MAG: hypothetical protein AB7S26_13650 [Sandaracinaceae bacterium]
MTYRSPLDAARARIAALEDLLESNALGVSEERLTNEGTALRKTRAQLAEERAEFDEERARLGSEIAQLQASLDERGRDVEDERARRQTEVSLLRSKLEEAERAIANNTALFEAEQTMQRAEAQAELARLRQTLVHKDNHIRELREEIRVFLGGDRQQIRAFYSARVRVVGTDLAEHGSLARQLERRIEDARAALADLPAPDARDRDGLIERELATRKISVGEAELQRVLDRITRQQEELTRITAAEAELAERG